MKTTYKLEITYESEEIKRIVEPYIDERINLIKRDLEANKNNSLTIQKQCEYF